MPPSWQKLTDIQRKDIVLKLLDQLDLSKKSLRMKAARTILYLAQGCFAEVQSDHEQQQWTRNNVKLLYEMGLFATFVELLNYEIEYVLKFLHIFILIRAICVEYGNHAEICAIILCKCHIFVAIWPSNYMWSFAWECILCIPQSDLLTLDNEFSSVEIQAQRTLQWGRWLCR